MNTCPLVATQKRVGPYAFESTPHHLGHNPSSEERHVTRYVPLSSACLLTFFGSLFFLVPLVPPAPAAFDVFPSAAVFFLPPPAGAFFFVADLAMAFKVGSAEINEMMAGWYGMVPASEPRANPHSLAGRLETLNDYPESSIRVTTT